MTTRTLTRIGGLAILGVLVITAIVYRDQLDPASLERAVQAAGPWGPVLFMTAFATATVLFLPGSAFSLAGGALFGPVLGTVYNLGAATVGATIAFLIARHLASDWVRDKSGPRLQRLLDGVDAEGWHFVAFVRLVPLFPFNLLNYALGLTGIRTVPYVVTTAICMIPGGFAYTYLGYAGREAIAGGEGAIQKGLLALGLVAAIAFLPRLVKRIRAGRGATLPVTELKQRVEAGEDLLLLDVRDAKDFTGDVGHVPGARNIPVGDLGTRHHELTDWKSRPLAVICFTDRKSKQALKFLKEQGFKNVTLVAGGMKEWRERDYPVE